MKVNFVNTVLNFKLEKKIKLKELFATDADEKIKRLRDIFLRQNAIVNYLARAAHFIQFNEDGEPKFKVDCTDKQAKRESDYYEQKIYTLLFKLKLPIPYRNPEEQFYNKGTTNLDILQSLYQLNCTASANQTLVRQAENIYQIRYFINKVKHGKVQLDLEGKPKIKFILTPNFKDNHATTLLHILSHDKIPLCSVFINSWISRSVDDELEYFRFISGIFNLKNYYNVELTDAQLEKLKKFPHDENFYCDDQPKAFDLDHCSDRLLHCYFSSSTDRFIAFDNAQIPIVDASHHLQMANNDRNCALYGLNFMRAIVHLLEDKTLAENIYSLAEKIYYSKQTEANLKKNTTANSAISALQQIFQQDLKAHLPMYYSEGKDRGEAERMQFHLKQRWTIGSEKIKSDYGSEIVK